MKYAALIFALGIALYVPSGAQFGLDVRGSGAVDIPAVEIMPGHCTTVIVPGLHPILGDYLIGSFPPAGEAIVATVESRYGNAIAKFCALTPSNGRQDVTVGPGRVSVLVLR